MSWNATWLSMFESCALRCFYNSTWKMGKNMFWWNVKRLLKCQRSYITADYVMPEGRDWRGDIVQKFLVIWRHSKQRSQALSYLLLAFGRAILRVVSPPQAGQSTWAQGWVSGSEYLTSAPFLCYFLPLNEHSWLVALSPTPCNNFLEACYV